MYIPIWEYKHVFSILNFKKICCSFAENKYFERSKMADVLWNKWCHNNTS